MELPRDENALTDILHLLDHSPGIQIRLLIAQVHFSGLNIALQSYERGLKLLALNLSPRRVMGKVVLSVKVSRHNAQTKLLSFIYCIKIKVLVT